VLVLGGAVLFQAAALSKGPQLTDDLYRYAWDGRVQSHGIDPYRWAPDDPHLARLRDPWLWPDPAGCAALGRPSGCTRLNRPSARTIYPPVAQVWFRALHALGVDHTRERGIQVAHAVVAFGVTGLLVVALGRLGRNPAWAVLWAWSPLAVLETGMDAHVDVVAVAAVVGALWALERRRAGLGGGLLGLAVAVKLIPGVLLPAGLRHRPVRMAAAAGAVVGLCYLPHVLAVGPRVLGYLPGYLEEEHYAEGGRFLLLGLLGVHGRLAQAMAVGILALVAAVVVARGGGSTVTTRARWLLVAAFLVATPVQPWYGLLLVAVAALDGSWAPLALAAAAYPLYFAAILDASPAGTGQLSYGVAAVVLAVGYLARRQGGGSPGRRRTSWIPSAVPR
jgi:hypothetical protein